MTPSARIDRRAFTGLLAGTALAAASHAADARAPAKRIRTGLIGCGSVSHSYLPVLTKSPFVEMVSLCDIRPERARAETDLAANRADLIAFGRPFLSNPNFVAKLRDARPLTPADPTTFFTPGEQGYLDYPVD